MAVWRTLGTGVFCLCGHNGMYTHFCGYSFCGKFFYKKILEITVNFILSYCAVMMLLNFIGGTDKTNFSEVPGSVDNVFWFKKDRLVPIEHGFLASVIYLYFILSTYFFSGKYFNKNSMIKTKP